MPKKKDEQEQDNAQGAEGDAGPEGAQDDHNHNAPSEPPEKWDPLYEGMRLTPVLQSLAQRTAYGDIGLDDVEAIVSYYAAQERARAEEEEEGEGGA